MCSDAWLWAIRSPVERRLRGTSSYSGYAEIVSLQLTSPPAGAMEPLASADDAGRFYA